MGYRMTGWGTLTGLYITGPKGSTFPCTMLPWIPTGTIGVSLSVISIDIPWYPDINILISIDMGYGTGVPRSAGSGVQLRC